MGFSRQEYWGGVPSPSPHWPITLQKCQGQKGQEQGTSLVVQWLRLHAPNARDPGIIPGWGAGSHMLQPRPVAAKY